LKPELLAPLALLALIDSTSFGTLLIPLWLMLAPGRPHPQRILLFLGTVAAFYLLLGLALLFGASTLLTRVPAMNPQQLRVAQLLVGIGLMLVGVLMEPWRKTETQPRSPRLRCNSRSGPSLRTRLLARASDASAPASATIALALTAAGIESASMLPYLAAIGVLAASELSLPGGGAVLMGYCLVMITPALVLLAARLLFHDAVAPVLARLEVLLSRTASKGIAWVILCLGIYLVGDSLQALT